LTGLLKEENFQHPLAGDREKESRNTTPEAPSWRSCLNACQIHRYVEIRQGRSPSVAELCGRETESSFNQYCIFGHSLKCSHSLAQTSLHPQEMVVVELWLRQ